MPAQLIFFYLISAMILGFGLFSVLTRTIFRAAVFLLFSLVGIAALYFLLEYEFIAAVQILVYVGGIVVLVIFSIFLTHKSGDKMNVPSPRKELAAFVFSFLGFAFVFLLIFKEHFESTFFPPLEPSVNNIGLQMLDTERFGFLLPFEVVSILLLAAMIGAIVIALKIRPKGE